jgi:hypothetical protein
MKTSAIIVTRLEKSTDATLKGPATKGINENHSFLLPFQAAGHQFQFQSVDIEAAQREQEHRWGGDNQSCHQEPNDRPAAVHSSLSGHQTVNISVENVRCVQPLTGPINWLI